MVGTFSVVQLSADAPELAVSIILADLRPEFHEFESFVKQLLSCHDRIFP